jgi:hypothetical protein
MAMPRISVGTESPVLIKLISVITHPTHPSTASECISANPKTPDP